MTKIDASEGPARLSHAVPLSLSNVNATSAGSSNCGFSSNGKESVVVAASPPGGAASLFVNDTMGFSECLTTYTQSLPDVTSYEAYEVALVTIVSRPDITFSLETGQVSLSSQQVASGGNNTIWTDFDPATVTTNSRGIAHSNFTIAGAYVISNPVPPSNESGVFRLPILALSQSGLAANASLPISFEGLIEGGLEPVYVFSSPGPILFPATSGMVAQYGQIEFLYGVVYAPLALETNATPLPVNLSVAGSWGSGRLGPMPQGVQVSFIPQSFDLRPDKIFFFWVYANNTLAPVTPPATANYTLAVRESFGNFTYFEPLTVSVWLSTPPIKLECCIEYPAINAYPAPNALIVYAPYLVAASIVLVIIICLVLYNRKSNRTEPRTRALQT